MRKIEIPASRFAGRGFSQTAGVQRNTKLVIIATLALIALGALVFFVSERQNAETLGPISSINQIFVSVFESISGRTAGFSTVGFGETEQHTNFFFTSLMFIGGASASVAGGMNRGAYGPAARRRSVYSPSGRRARLSIRPPAKALKRLWTGIGLALPRNELRG